MEILKVSGRVDIRGQLLLLVYYRQQLHMVHHQMSTEIITESGMYPPCPEPQEYYVHLQLPYMWGVGMQGQVLCQAGLRHLRGGWYLLEGTLHHSVIRYTHNACQHPPTPPDM